jgi:hypothetical protein
VDEESTDLEKTRHLRRACVDLAVSEPEVLVIKLSKGMLVFNTAIGSLALSEEY